MSPEVAGLGVGVFPFFSGIVNGGGIALRGDNASLREVEDLGSDAVAEGLLPVLGFLGTGVPCMMIVDEPGSLVKASRRDLTSSSGDCVLSCESETLRAEGVGVSAREAALPLRWIGGRRSRERLRGP